MFPGCAAIDLFAPWDGRRQLPGIPTVADESAAKDQRIGAVRGAVQPALTARRSVHVSKKKGLTLAISPGSPGSICR